MMGYTGFPDFSHESALIEKGFMSVCGVDEAGRGPLAGPVVAGAVILDPGVAIEGLNDSKLLTEKGREAMYDRIASVSLAWAFGVATHEEIDGVNILQATFLAMSRAIEGLRTKPDHVLVDGRMAIRGVDIPQTAIVKGDRLCASIAAASVIAKVTRDRMMVDFDGAYPGYGFGKHKGYCTKEHVRAIRELGPSPIQRVSFRVPGEDQADETAV